MSTVKMSTVKQWITSRQHAFERRTAPHVDPAWSRALLLELRLRGAGGAEIGAVLAEVDSHCAESGESAAEAFGPAVDYARTLDLHGDQDTDTRALLAGAGQSVLQVVGMLGILWGFRPWLAGDLLDLTGGHLALLSGIVALLAVVVWRVDAVLRAVVDHPVVTWLVSMVGIALAVVVLRVLDDVAIRLDAGWATLVAGGLLLLGTVLGLRSIREDDVDPVVVPLQPPGRTARRGARLLALSAHLLLPALTLVAVLVVWIAER